jgi:alpha-1,2-mannosyltransferase
VFYLAAAAALHGKSVYIIVGELNLPFWYPPWSAWMFIPYAIFPRAIAVVLFVVTCMAAVALVIRYLTRYYNPDFGLLDKLLIGALLIPMSNQLFNTAQIDYLLLGLAVLAIWGVETKRDILVGLLYPLLLTKPHLVIPFTAYLFLRAGKRALLVSVLTTAALLLAATILRPQWYLEMLGLFQQLGGRVDGLPFTTLPTLLGLQENWTGTANLPFTVLLILLAAVLLWPFRRMPPVPFLSLALAASLFCAPRSHAYDLPFLIPAMIWLTVDGFPGKAWLWFVAALVPIATSSSPLTYLVTLLVFGLAIQKAFRWLRFHSLLRAPTQV